MKTPLSSKSSYLIWSFIMSLIFIPFFFVGNEFIFGNIGFTLFYTLFFSGFILIAEYFEEVKNRWGYLIVFAIFPLLLDLLIFHHAFVVFAIPFVLIILGWIMLLLLLGKHSWLDFWRNEILREPIQTVIETIETLINVLVNLVDFSSFKKVKLGYILIGCIIAFPLMLVFGEIFSEVDPNFKETYINLYKFLKIDEDLIAHIIRTVFFTISFSFLVLLCTTKYNRETSFNFPKIPHAIFSTTLFLLNGLFILFNYFQVKFVLLNNFAQDHFISNGITYADYAKEGFSQLLAASFIVFFLILAVYIFQERHKILSYLLAATSLQTIIIGFSALKRMNLYQDAYGFTPLRLYGEWIMYTLIILFVFTIGVFLLQKYEQKLGSGIFIISLMSFVLMAGINIPKIVDEHNELFYAGSNEQYEKYNEIDIQNAKEVLLKEKAGWRYFNHRLD